MPKCEHGLTSKECYVCASPKHAAQAEKQEPVAWRTFDGEGGYDYRSYEDNEDYGYWWEERHPNHKGWVEPLYTTPQPQQKKKEPVAIYQYQLASGSWIDQTKNSYDYNVRHGQATVRVVYTTPQPQQEPVKMVAYNCLCGRIMKFESVNGIVAPQREWVGLTEEEITALKRNGERYISSQEFARAIEAKLKEKNT